MSDLNQQPPGNNLMEPKALAILERFPSDMCSTATELMKAVEAAYSAAENPNAINIRLSTVLDYSDEDEDFEDEEAFECLDDKQKEAISNRPPTKLYIQWESRPNDAPDNTPRRRFATIIMCQSYTQFICNRLNACPLHMNSLPGTAWINGCATFLVNHLLEND